MKAVDREHLMNSGYIIENNKINMRRRKLWERDGDLSKENFSLNLHLKSSISLSRAISCAYLNVNILFLYHTQYKLIPPCESVFKW